MVSDFGHTLANCMASAFVFQLSQNISQAVIEEVRGGLGLFIFKWLSVKGDIADQLPDDIPSRRHFKALPGAVLGTSGVVWTNSEILKMRCLQPLKIPV